MPEANKSKQARREKADETNKNKQKCMPEASKSKQDKRGKADETSKTSICVCRQQVKASKIKEERQTKQTKQA